MSTPAPNDENESSEMIRTLEDIAEKFKKNVKLEDRRWHLKTYKNCFVGSDAVNWLVESGMANTRKDAVLLGKTLATECNLFEHVVRDHEFKDELLFYRFVEHGERGSVELNHSGKVIGWGDFLEPSSGTSSSPTSGNLQPDFPHANLEAISGKDVHVASKVWPLDKFNQELLDQVHPPNWQDPKPSEGRKSTLYDMVVIGAGPGGLVAAAGSAGLGAKVALIEAHMLGGDCLNAGCVPSKAIIHSANLAHRLGGDPSYLAEAGLELLDPSALKVNFEKVMERCRRIRAEISHRDSAERFSKELGIEVFIGRGKFKSERTVEVNGRTLCFKKAVIASGSYAPVELNCPGLQELFKKSSTAWRQPGVPQVVTNETIFNLTKKPRSMVVVEGGDVGLELAQAFQRLGVSVTVLERNGGILKKEDPDLAQMVKEHIQNEGVEFRLTVKKYVGIRETKNVLDSGYPEMEMAITEKAVAGTTTLKFDVLLLGVGRRPNVTGLNLEAANVLYCTRTGLRVNDMLQTTNPRVYGVGDCCSKFKFTHAADFMARVVIKNALFFGSEKMSDLLIPYTTFTSPEVASVGLYERDLKARWLDYRIIEKHFKDNDRSNLDNSTMGLVRLRVDSKTDKILGATIVGDGAGNMIGEVALAMQSATGLGTLASVIHPYPTKSEAIRQAGDLYNKTRITPPVKKILRGCIKMQAGRVRRGSEPSEPLGRAEYWA